MKKKLVTVLLMITVLTGMVAATGCGNSSGKDGKIHINLVQYKPEAVKAFEKMEEEIGRASCRERV